MNFLDDGGEQSPIISSIISAIAEINLFRKFNMTDAMISSLDEETSQLIDAEKFKQYLHMEILDNEPEMRKFELHARVTDNTETAIEYYSQDYLTHPEYHYDKKFQSKIYKINLKVNDFLGKLLKLLTEEDEDSY